MKEKTTSELFDPAVERSLASDGGSDIKAAALPIDAGAVIT